MARPKSPPRVCGPYEERGGTRFRIRVIGNGTEKNLYFPTRAEALVLPRTLRDGHRSRAVDGHQRRAGVGAGG